MFEDNSFIHRMKNYMNDALEGSYRHLPCAKELVPMVKDFFKKCMETDIAWDGDVVCWQIEHISEIVKFLAMNTRNYEQMSEKDVLAFKNIFNELGKLYDEVLSFNTQSTCEKCLREKISCISEIVCKNMVGMYDSEEDHANYRDGMIFQNPESLWKVIHRVNTEWEELRSRGFTIRVFQDFWECFKYDHSFCMEKAEEEKLQEFMDLLDGKKKFVPIYEYKPVGYKLENADYEGEIVRKRDNSRYSNPYGLLPKNEKVGGDTE